jgi:5-formyltetrahydrofolate cyclo-ligase
MILDKPALRARLRAARRDFARDHALLVPNAYLTRLSAGLIVAAYHPVGGEADPAPLVAAARAAGCVLALPHVVDRATRLRFLETNERSHLESGPFGLGNPPAHGREVAPEIILTPLVGFDRRGNRLGQGAGHYDRAFADYPGAWRVGLAWSVQEVAALAADPWDVPLHAIATEREWIVVA